LEHNKSIDNKLALYNERLAHLDRKLDDIFSFFSVNKHVIQKTNFIKLVPKNISDIGVEGGGSIVEGSHY